VNQAHNARKIKHLGTAFFTTEGGAARSRFSVLSWLSFWLGEFETTGIFF